MPQVRRVATTPPHHPPTTSRGQTGARDPTPPMPAAATAAAAVTTAAATAATAVTAAAAAARRDEGQGEGEGDDSQSGGSRRVTSRALGMFFFSILFSYFTNFSLFIQVFLTTSTRPTIPRQYDHHPPSRPVATSPPSTKSAGPETCLARLRPGSSFFFSYSNLLKFIYD
jgi:hypothetical protein